MQALTAEQYARLEQLADAYRHRYGAALKRDPRRNPRLGVDLLCFQPFGEALCGALLTPISLSLVLVPAAEDPWPGDGAARRVDLPGGRYPFVAEGLGGEDWLWHCALLEDLRDLESLQAANRLAQRLLTTVMSPPEAPRGRL